MARARSSASSVLESMPWMNSRTWASGANAGMRSAGTMRLGAPPSTIGAGDGEIGERGAECAVRRRLLVRRRAVAREALRRLAQRELRVLGLDDFLDDVAKLAAHAALVGAERAARRALDVAGPGAVHVAG